MAAAKRKPREKPPTPDLETYVAKATAVLERSHCLALSKLGPAGIRSQVVERLVAAGFEASGTQVRKPLAEQLTAALEDGATIAMNSVKSHLAGASAADIKRVIQEAIANGRAAVVLRGKQLAVTRPQPGLILPSELSQLKRALDAAQKTLDAALKAKPPAALLRGDFEGMLPKLSPPHPAAKRATDSSTASARSSLARVLQAVADSSEGSLGLAFVPRIIAKLAPDLSAEEARQVLLEAAQAGRLELRPEGGLARLSQAELDLCPKGAMGVALTWARQLVQST